MSFRRARFWPTCLLRAALLVGVAFGGSAAHADEVADVRAYTYRRAAVVSVDDHGSRAGAEILAAGGNAVDAAVATAFTLAVTYPPAGNIGGGGFMIVYPADGREPVCIEYRETAPAASTASMFSLDADRHTAEQVGVPGTIRGLALAHQKFGRLPWARLVMPAILLATDGFPVSAALALDLNEVLAEVPLDSEFYRTFGKPDGDDPWITGDRLKQPDLAKTLHRLAEHGPDEFYTGETARLIVAEMQADGGLVTAADLAAYRAHLREPIHGTFRGFDAYGAPPPSSGGICLVQMLNVLETLDLRTHGRWSPEGVHLVIEAMRRAYLDRARWLGDPDFTDIPAKLTSKEYARELADAIDPERATPSEDLAGPIALAGEGSDTTHFSIVDANGMAVSNTYTLEESWGSRIVVRGAGFLLNNEMGDFNPMPGHTDRLGHIGTPANIVAPGKRMLSSQCPVVVARDGRAVLVTGSPGGRTIINTVLCVLLGVLEYGEDLRTAVDAPRLHHQWLPDRVLIESREGRRLEGLAEALKQRGHDVSLRQTHQGDAHSIWIDPQTGLRHAVPDRRIDGHAAGL